MIVCISGDNTALVPANHVHAAVIASGFEITQVISPGGIGADRSGEWWAIDHGKPWQVIAQDTGTWGKIARAMQVQAIASHCSALILLDNSRETKALASLFRSLGKPVYIHRTGGLRLAR